MENETAAQTQSLNEKARSLADSCDNVGDLRRAVESFDGGEIRENANNTVFSNSITEAKVMIIGEAPGENEDNTGIPFSGRSGEELNAWLREIGLNRETVCISNVVFWRPPANRTPTDEELDMCRPFVEKHIALISPEIMICIGGTASSSLLDKTKTISELRGTFHRYTNQYLNNCSITATALFHPSYILRKPSQREKVLEDLQEIKEYLENL